MSDNQNRWCFCHSGRSTEGSRAALLDAARWPTGTTISIKFLEGDAGLQQRVKDVANGWTSLANLGFDFRNAGDTDMRIAFQQGKGSWSYLGTVCRQIPQDEPTMNYGWLTPDSPDDVLRRVVLHEFGHALGLIHEHQNPQGGIQWNRDAVIRDLSGPPNNWSLETIEFNIFQRNSLSEVTATSVDKASIMMYVIPQSWTLDGFSSDLNSELSVQDKEFIRTAYPS
jgi:serralysin